MTVLPVSRLSRRRGTGSADHQIDIAFGDGQSNPCSSSEKLRACTRASRQTHTVGTGGPWWHPVDIVCLRAVRGIILSFDAIDGNIIKLQFDRCVFDLGGTHARKHTARPITAPILVPVTHRWARARVSSCFLTSMWASCGHHHPIVRDKSGPRCVLWLWIGTLSAKAVGIPVPCCYLSGNFEGEARQWRADEQQGSDEGG